MPLVLLFIAGGAIGGYLAVKQRRAHRAAAVAEQVVAPDAGPIVMVTPPVPTRPPPSDMLIAKPAALAEIRIDSEPYGASVTLVDNGTQTPLGSTPLFATVETARHYELVIAHPSYPTQTVALDPQTTTRVVVPLAGKRTVATTAKPSAPKPSVAAAVASTPPTPERTPPAPAAPKARRAPVVAPVGALVGAPPRAPVAAAATGEGVLMLSAKPPCEIAIDGKATGLTTPQRSIALSAGTHKVTLTNTMAGVRDTFTVKITPGAPTKVIRDLMPR